MTQESSGVGKGSFAAQHNIQSGVQNEAQSSQAKHTNNLVKPYFNELKNPASKETKKFTADKEITNEMKFIHRISRPSIDSLGKILHPRVNE